MRNATSGAAIFSPARRSSVTLRTLGRFALIVGRTGLSVPSTHKARALLAFLAMHRGFDIARERLMETFWPEVEPQRARDSLNTALHAVRWCFRQAGLVPEPFITATRTVVTWIAQTEYDVDFLLSLGSGTDAVTLRTAIDECCGEFLPGCYDEWSVEQRERLSAVYERALVAAVRKLGDIEAARRLIDLDPYEESSYLLLLDAAAAAGQPAVWAKVAGRCRAAFAESGIRPSPELEIRLSRTLTIRSPDAERPLGFGRMPFGAGTEVAAVAV